MSKRARAGAFAVLAVVCAAASAGIAAGYRDSVDEQLGELGVAVVVTEPLDPGRPLGRRTLARSTEARRIPLRYLPPDVLGDSVEALGRRLRGPVPAGSYLLVSHLRAPGPSRQQGPEIPTGRRPVEIGVRGGGALELGGGSGMVDVVVAEEPGGNRGARVRVAARGVRLLALAETASEELGEGGAWTATLALTRGQALELIEAENFAREIRLIPRG